ncbi:alpha/beta hydrolase [Pseudoalteromonas luteoviolacea]|uniref:alpha/beta hydrolase family protein n=1 Tax=Pseudoalteromonas luteoviolacea TaxID=43657 RepID=UPI001B3A6E66|nr:alpha/beta hydrolase [Pseudoalteromonas luteoviolacea]MBQ4880445.1 alpha/beta hydrolase [Pseudoalteromonas luteoviolacea]MBQ4909496.1 alpha/beta hydrolase [Pseudoalteromonas luteoviolacea]
MNIAKGFICFMALYSGAVFASCKNNHEQVNVNGTCTKIQTYKSDKLTKSPILLVSLHGDSPFSGPSYQYFFASILAKKVDNLVAVGLLRPGYTDAMNQTSDGERGQTTGENYSDDRVKQIAQAISALKARHNADKLIVAGHSGGGAITAKIVAQFPRLIDHAYIVSCPCDINEWRKYISDTRGWRQFKGDIDVSSPVELVKHIPKSTKITLLVGDQDDITKPQLTLNYKNALDKHHIDNELEVIAGGHDIFLFPEVTSHVTNTIQSYNQ